MTFTRIVEKAQKANDAKDDDLKYNHVAIITRSNKPLVIGVNKAKSHPITLKHPYGFHNGLHAELDACIKLGKDDCSDYTMIVIRFRKDGSLANSKPCKGCQSLLNQLGFKKVFYSTEMGEFDEL